MQDERPARVADVPWIWSLLPLTTNTALSRSRSKSPSSTLEVTGAELARQEELALVPDVDEDEIAGAAAAEHESARLSPLRSAAATEAVAPSQRESRAARRPGPMEQVLRRTRYHLAKDRRTSPLTTSRVAAAERRAGERRAGLAQIDRAAPLFANTRSRNASPFVPDRDRAAVLGAPIATLSNVPPELRKIRRPDAGRDHVEVGVASAGERDIRAERVPRAPSASSRALACSIRGRRRAAPPCPEVSR
jgi:hypothetical protein